MLFKKIKNLLREIVFIERLYSNFANRQLNNIYKSKSDKKVLISYITIPFRKNSLSHTNNYEASTAAKIFDELGYVVDVIHYEGIAPDLSKYDVIYGFGDVFRKYFEGGTGKAKTIYYGAGMHVCHQNTITLKRVKDVYGKKGCWLAGSARFVEKTWTHQTSLVDGIIALGNSECAKTYRKYYDGKIYSIDAPFYQTIEAEKIVASRDGDANKSYLWFGSAGLIHKGLDLCLDYFKSRPDLTLHVCGNVYLEPQFLKAYHHELFELPNIIVHGFIHIEANEFKEVLKKCTFIISPSCSEGGSPSVLTAIGNGALIPIITKESSLSTGYEVWIDDLTVESIAKSIEYTQSLSEIEIKNLQLSNLACVRHQNSQSKYYENLKFSITDLIYN
jgi:hypothetical protein